jgi:hypothetical protein
VRGILSGDNFADIRHRLRASSLSVYLANTSVVMLLSSVRVHEVCFGNVVFFLK